MTDTAITARAFRAARAWADASQGDMAAAMGTSVPTIKRIEAGDRDLSPPERMFVARHCGVPEDFLTGGFDGIRTPDA